MKTVTELCLVLLFFLALNFGLSYSQSNLQDEFNEVIPQVVSNYTTALEQYKSHPSKENREHLEIMRNTIFNKTGFSGYKLLEKIKEIFHNGSSGGVGTINCTGCDTLAAFEQKYHKKLDEEADNGFYGLMYHGTNSTIKALVNEYQNKLDKFIKEKSVKNRDDLESQYNTVIAAIGQNTFDHLRRFKSWVDDNKKHIFSGAPVKQVKQTVAAVTPIKQVNQTVAAEPKAVVPYVDSVFLDILKKFGKAKLDCMDFKKDCDAVLKMDLWMSNSKLSLRQASLGTNICSTSVGPLAIIATTLLYKIMF